MHTYECTPKLSGASDEVVKQGSEFQSLAVIGEVRFMKGVGSRGRDSKGEWVMISSGDNCGVSQVEVQMVLRCPLQYRYLQCPYSHRSAPTRGKLLFYFKNEV